MNITVQGGDSSSYMYGAPGRTSLRAAEVGKTIETHRRRKYGCGHTEHGAAWPADGSPDGHPATAGDCFIMHCSVSFLRNSAASEHRWHPSDGGTSGLGSTT